LTCDRVPSTLPIAAIRFHVDPCFLAKDELCYVGEPVALIIADTRAAAEDAAALVALDLELLPAILDPHIGLAPGAPKARLTCPRLPAPPTSARPPPRRKPASPAPTISLPTGPWPMATPTRPSLLPPTASPQPSACTRAAAMPSRRAAWWRVSIRPRICLRSG